jgi:hypothetical protein
MIFLISTGFTCFTHVIVLHLHNFWIPVHNKKEMELEKMQNLTWAFFPNNHNRKKITSWLYYTFKTTIFNYIKRYLVHPQSTFLFFLLHTHLLELATKVFLPSSHCQKSSKTQNKNLFIHHFDIIHTMQHHQIFQSHY